MDSQIIIFTDGSYSSKTKRAGYGIYFPNEPLSNVSKPFNIKPITSQRAELYAIYIALRRAIKSKPSKIMIYTDSNYSINSITKWMSGWINNGWMTSNDQPVKNKDILTKINKIYTKHKDIIIFKHVASHTKKNDIISQGNDIADKLAKRHSL